MDKDRALVAVVAALAFGAADQYLGSLAGAAGWAPALSGLSAPWLLVAFGAGWTQPRARQAATLGLVSTVAALAGYWAMTLSPIEGARVTAPEIRGLLVSNSLLIAGALITGPLFGWLGYRWRVHRDWLSGLTAALAVCFEPLVDVAAGPRVGWAHLAVSTAGHFHGVGELEMGAGFLLLVYVLSAARRGAVKNVAS